MPKRLKQQVVLSEDASHLLSQIPESKDMPILPNEQIEEVAEQVRKRLRQRVGQAQAEEWRKKQEQIEKTGREEIAPGLEGVLTVAGKETEKVHFFEILVNGQRFFGLDAFKPMLEEYLASVPEDTVDVTFFHSSRIPLDLEKTDRRRKKPVQPPPPEKRERIDINCTVRVPKALAMAALEDKIMRMKEIARIGVRIEERQQREQAAATPPDSTNVQPQTSGHQ